MKRLFALLALAACSKHGDGTPSHKTVGTPVASATAAFVDVTVIPMDSEHELAHQTVLVDKDRIVAIGPADTTGVPANVKTIDGKGKYLVPGLVDMHVHFNDKEDATLFLANGVTTVRNMWGFPEHLEWRTAAKEPGAFLPTIYTTGPILDGKPPVWPTAKVLETPAEAVAEVTAEKQAGYDFLKVYNRLSLPVYDALVAEAKRQGIRVVGHVPDAVGVEHALTSQTTIEHLDGYLLAAQDATSKAASLPHEQRTAEEVAHFDPAKLATLAKQTHDAGVANVPTLIVLARVGALDHPEQLAARPENKYVARETLAMWDPKHDFRFAHMTPEDFAAFRKANELRTQIVKALHDAGAAIFAGTDTPNPYVVPGFGLHDELGLLAGAGLTPYEALRAATAAPAAWLDPAAKFGTITVGARADLVLLDADPLHDITATTHRSGVMVRGTWYDKAALDARLAALAKARAEAPADLLAGAPPLPDDPKDGPTIFTASYTTKVGDMKVAHERLAIHETGKQRVIVGQVASRRGLLSVREELSDGQFRRLVIAAGDKKTTVTATGGKLVIEGEKPARIAFPADGLVDANLVATMIPFADRARTATGKRTVTGKLLDPGGQLDDISYSFTVAPGKLPFEVTNRFGKASGAYVTDAAGFPSQITLQVFGGVTVVRDP